MKYAVIAALLASNTQALTGCKKGLGTKIYSDDKCKEATTAEFTLLEEDVEKTGSCQSFEATKDDVKAVTQATKTLKTKQDAAKVAKDSFARNQDIDVEDASGKSGPANEIFPQHYAEIRAAFVKYRTSLQVGRDYLDDNESATAAAESYYTEYEKLFDEEAKDDADQDKVFIKDQKEVVATKAKALPKNCDPKMIETIVQDEKAYSKLLKKHVPTAQQANYEAFLKRDHKAELTAQAVKDQENVLATVTKRVDNHTYSKIITCDIKDGVKIKYYDGVDCKDKPEQEYTAQWGKCTKMGENYFKITGAATLQAAAVAIVAFAGSQF